ncbi:hypothetical protein CFIMG_002871RA [Ceratocystis fimbriata CBS 114723]|uniref:Arf-GAP domain-containing protein n=1 Tax=Ceratocystis fimbriata CBS 114723 TaxID=1035309 RepID=A0A2C5X2G0_9PEZI|nr:hypothetical protein CFIMG_002871RA [Ceratocystis fimbriata CBS 114723]
MSRRSQNPAAERIAQNQQTIKSLLKLECNKVCADCKRNKHPRWASWNIGIFICIRCSGIHRSMGTHISRVKSVDLDSWTDEQVASVLAWGNARANKYWETKLAAGHVPSENKIENFIRTKYELKRWAMDGPRPDPASLDVDGDEDIPLSLVKEKHNIERKESIRKASVGQSSAPAARKAAPPPPQVDLIGGESPSPIPPAAVPAKATAKTSAAKPSGGRDSLLGLDFFGDATSSPSRPSSTSNTGSGGAQSRPDLKQSILSLYASAPRTQPAAAAQPAAATAAGGFGGMGSPAHQSQASFGGLNDAFGGLNFGGASAPTTAAAPIPPPKPVDPFASFGLGSSKSPAQASSNSAFSNLGGGSFFDAKPAATAPSHTAKQPSFSGFGDFASPAAASSSKPAQPSAMGDLFDLSTPSPAATSAVSQPMSSASAFNLTSSASKSPAAAPATTTSFNVGGTNSALSGSDVWGNNAWGSESKTETAKPAATPSGSAAPATNDFGWGSAASSSFASTSIVPGATGGFAPTPKVAADEEFGGWASNNTPTTSTTISGGNKGFGASAGGDSDLFSNVWQ